MLLCYRIHCKKFATARNSKCCLLLFDHEDLILGFSEFSDIP